MFLCLLWDASLLCFLGSSMENDKISTVPTSRLSEALGSRWFRGVLALLTFVYMFYKPTASVGGYASSALFGLCVLWIVWPRLKCLFRREAAVFKKSKSKALRNKSKKSKS